MARGQFRHINSGQVAFKPFTQNVDGTMGPSYYEPVINTLLFPRLGPLLTHNISLPYQQARAVMVNMLFAKLPEGHG